MLKEWERHLESMQCERLQNKDDFVCNSDGEEMS